MRTPEYHDLAPLVRLAGIAVWMQTACYGVSLIADGFDYATRSSLVGLGPEDVEQRMAMINALVGLCGLVTTVVVIFTAVVVLRSIYRANRNLHARSVSGLEYTPGWCVGWFFIPIASLWKPYQAFKETWMASHDPVQFSVDRPGIMPLWWTLFLISNITGNLSARLDFFGGGNNDQATSTLLSMISLVASIPEGLILLVMLRQIAKAQERTLNIDIAFS